ncbi:MAG: hypothetical protein JXA21_29600 [Anaerolineae bacterium]|nr:hypothetical protein [Anaerolineae bacterium]
MGMQKNPKPKEDPILIDHVVDAYRSYPGETRFFFTRVRIQQDVSKVKIQITVPEGLILEDFLSTPECNEVSVWTESEVGPNHLEWQVNQKLQAGAVLEYQARVTITHKNIFKPEFDSVVVESRARATAVTQNGDDFTAQGIVSIEVSFQGQYIQYLPALYQSDDFMGRFLMLFESFLAPIDKQTDTLPMYFDPQMTPSEFLPWLASWFNLLLDDNLSEKQRRDLVQWAFLLYRKRGTKQGLQTYLEIYTRGQAKITEHRGNNFRLGSQARMGTGLALGTENRPHTFTVNLHLPAASLSKEERNIQYRKIETLIETEKPAHTGYILHIEESDQAVTPPTSIKSKIFD